MSFHSGSHRLCVCILALVLHSVCGGDAAGDAFFGLYEKSAPLVCAGNSSASNKGILCQNTPILQIPGFNVYTATRIEADERFGDYAECNPNPDTGIFSCTHFHHHRGPTPCWDRNPEHPEWKTQFADVCNATTCKCDAIETLAVGREFVDFGQHTPPGTPKSCAAAFYVLPHVAAKDAPYRTIKTDLAGCCDACTKDNAKGGTQCKIYTHNSLRGTCSLHRTADFSSIKPSLTSSSGFYSGTGVKAFVERATGQLSELMNGTWYSTQKKGQCKEGEVIGRDCWWRVLEQQRQVNSTCVNNNMIRKVVARHPACFNACPRPHDQNSECWIGCLFETLVGNASAGVTPTPREVIVEAFESSFTKTDTKEGGCPDVPDCPEPCLPPCWGVPKGAPCKP